MMFKQILRICAIMVFTAYSALCQDVAEMKEYNINRVSGIPPVIDGEWTEEEWAGSEWTGGFYGTRHSFNDASLWGAELDIGYQWRALWDDEQIYFLVTMPMLYINPNGLVWTGDLIDPLAADDVGYAGWANGQCLNIEFFLTPNWPVFEEFGEENIVGGDPSNYHFVYFPLLADIDESGTEWAPSNFGVRGAEGPPYFFTGHDLPGDWAPITDPAAANEAGVLPLQLASQPHLIDGAIAGEEVVGIPALELAIPYSALSFAGSPDINDILDTPVDLEPLILVPDNNGSYVKVDDQWLINWTSYVDGARLEKQGLGLANWNDMGDGGFHNAPRGIMTFVETSNVNGWMIY